MSLQLPSVVDKFFEPSFYDKLRTYIEAQPMTHGAKSNSNTDPHGHWSWKPFHDHTENLAGLEHQIKEPLLIDALATVLARLPHMRVIRCYANGYGYGDDGYFHTDSKRPGDVTVIVFICDRWDPDWAGETALIQGLEYRAYMPVPNRVLFIPANMSHAARAVSRKCSALRRTFMFKLRPKFTQDGEHLSQWLVNNGALRHGHGSGGTLHDHLVRVHQALEVHGADRETCLGGGLHSIYGTNVYQQRIVSNATVDRCRVASEFGRDVEELAYLFSIVDRPMTLEVASTIQNLVKLKYIHSDYCYVPEVTARRLCLIECANLADQNSLDKWPNLRQLWKGACGDNSVSTGVATGVARA